MSGRIQSPWVKTRIEGASMFSPWREDKWLPCVTPAWGQEDAELPLIFLTSFCLLVSGTILVHHPVCRKHRCLFPVWCHFFFGSTSRLSVSFFGEVYDPKLLRKMHLAVPDFRKPRKASHSPQPFLCKCCGVYQRRKPQPPGKATLGDRAQLVSFFLLLRVFPRWVAVRFCAGGQCIEGAAFKTREGLG